MFSNAMRLQCERLDRENVSIRSDCSSTNECFSSIYRLFLSMLGPSLIVYDDIGCLRLLLLLLLFFSLDRRML